MNALAKIEFWFDFASTYSYPAAMRVEELAGSHGCIVQWRPFLLGAIFQNQGWNDSPFNIYPAKGRYMWRDLERLCASLEIPFRKPSQFPRNGLTAARVACANAGAAWIALFVRRVYEANFAHDLDIAQPSVLLDCLDRLVDDPAAVLATARGNEAKVLPAAQHRAGRRSGNLWRADVCRGRRVVLGQRSARGGVSSGSAPAEISFLKGPQAASLRPGLLPYTIRKPSRSAHRAWKTGSLHRSTRRLHGRARTTAAR